MTETAPDRPRDPRVSDYLWAAEQQLEAAKQPNSRRFDPATAQARAALARVWLDMARFQHDRTTPTTKEH